MQPNWWKLDAARTEIFRVRCARNYYEKASILFCLFEALKWCPETFFIKKLELAALLPASLKKEEYWSEDGCK